MTTIKNVDNIQNVSDEEILSQNIDEDGKAHLRRVSLKERLSLLVRDVEMVRMDLMEATTEETVKNAVNRLSLVIRATKEDEQLKNWDLDITSLVGMERALKLHDVTRDKFCMKLTDFIEELKSIIENEDNKEKARKVRNILEQLVEHADEMSNIIDFNQIFD